MCQDKYVMRDAHNWEAVFSPLFQFYRKNKKYFDHPRSDFILEIDHYMFRVFGHKYDKESPCKWVLVNYKILCFGHFTAPC